MFSTGTGFAPFASVLRDPETYEKFESVVVTHTCRDVAELSYSKNLVASLKDDPLIGDLVGGKIDLFSLDHETNICPDGPDHAAD